MSHCKRLLSTLLSPRSPWLGDTDDMALAWEMLELARLIYNNNGAADTHANKLADCHLYIGDILAEQVGDSWTSLLLTTQASGRLGALLSKQLFAKKRPSMATSVCPAVAATLISCCSTTTTLRQQEIAPSFAASCDCGRHPQGGFRGQAAAQRQ